MSGLSINPVNNYSSYYTQNTSSSARLDFQNVAQALEAGDLAAARTAFTALQKTFQTQSSITQSSSWSSIVGGISSITQALNSGDLAAAQAAYADLQQSLQSQLRGSSHAPVTRGSSSSRT
jgi:ribosomal protein S20